MKKLAGQIKLVEGLAKKLANRDYMEAELLERAPRQRNMEAHTGDKLWAGPIRVNPLRVHGTLNKGAGGKAERIEGMELRALRKVLDEVDTKQEWRGLKKVLTPEGHYLWLCKEHGEEYKK